MTYEVGERYRGKGAFAGNDMEIVSIYRGWYTLYDHTDTYAFTCKGSVLLDNIGERTHEKDGIPVEAEVLADRLYPVEISKHCVRIKFDDGTYIAVAAAAGYADSEGRLCLGFTRKNWCKDVYRGMPQYDDGFLPFARFRHHSLIRLVCE